MGFLFGENNKQKNILIFDIGSGSVGGALVHIYDEHKVLPRIIKSARSEIISSGDENDNSSFSNMLSALKFTTTSLHREKIGKVDGIYCFLSSPWSFSEPDKIKYTNDEPFIFNEELANQLINKKAIDIEEIYKEKYPSIGVDFDIIEHNIMSVLLNGYKVDSPLRKKAKEVDLYTIISVAPKNYLSEIKNIISKSFYHDHLEIKFSSFLAGSYLAVRDRYNSIDSFILIDISGDVTDIGIVEKGILLFSISFPFGRKSFYNYICSKTDLELRDVEEIFRLYSLNNISEKHRVKIEKVLNSVENSWGESFRQSIDALPRTFVLPNAIFLTADNDIKDWFSKIVCSRCQIEERIGSGKCTVYSLSGEEFLNMCDVSQGTCDPFLMIEAIALERKIKKNDI